MPTEGARKDRFTSLDTLALARELRRIAGARVDKAFDDATPGGWILTLRVPGQGRFELRLVPGRYAALLPKAAEVEHAEGLEPFAKELRRLLTGAVLDSVAEPGGERYLELRFRRGGLPEVLRLAVELFGSGNAVVAQGETLAAVLHPKTWRNRVVRVGAEYAPPPSRANPWELEAAALGQALLTSRTDLVSTLAARLAFGGPVAEELLARAGLDGSEPASQDAAERAEQLVPVLRGLLAEVGEAPRGYLYLEGGEPADVEPFRSRRSDRAGAAAVVEETETFSEAADRYFSSTRPVDATPSAEDLARAAVDRLRVQQMEAVRQLEAEAATLRRQADLLLHHYAEVEARLAQARTGGAPAETVTVELEGVAIPVAVSGSPRSAAQAIYEEMKRVQGKLSGAQAALAETERGLRHPAPPSPKRAARSSVARTRLWFEQYRWFVTSEGALVIGGRDAGSNDRIVKRYLGSEDRYFHADIHGAPSVVLKRPSSAAPIGEASLREAAQWALSFSKAWRAGLASGDAFWVTAEQVSKSAATGEFVARGAWVIHGTKHVIRDLPLELAVGTIPYEGSDRWVAAPPAALEARGDLRVRVTPGEERERPVLEVELARLLGLSRNELQSLLPSGGIRFLRA